MPDRAVKRSRNSGDTRARERFRAEIERNFSVIAPAGVGKTKAIVSRIVNIALGSNELAEAYLPTLVVVTYIRKAAMEMKTRAHDELLRRGVHPERMTLLNQAYFGTIHSFCLELIRRYGHVLGLPSSVELVENEETLWLEFIRGRDDVTSALPPTMRERFKRHVHVGRVVELARKWNPGGGPEILLSERPEIDLEPALSCPANRRSKGSVEEGQAQLRRWMDDLANGTPYLPLPDIKKGGREFIGLVEECFRALHTWLQRTAAVLVGSVADEYRKHRVGRGLLSYDDMIHFAKQLLSHSVAGRRIRECGYRVVLDEAQDTDREQFEVLLALAQTPEFAGDWRRADSALPGPGRFCMVGDPQQSIYGARADLATYLNVHRRLQEGGSADTLEFSVTFRCDENIVAAVNELFPRLLDERDGQVRFEPLRARPDAGSGQVVRCKLVPPEKFNPDVGINEAAEAEGRALAHWIAGQNLKGFGVQHWADVAILCPRKRWLPTLAYALADVGLSSVVQSRGDVGGDNPAYAWLTGLMVALSEPDNGFEIVGVLRDIFGISDHDLAGFVNSHRKGPPQTNPWQILERTQECGSVGETLDLLADIREECLELALLDLVTVLIEKTMLRVRLGLLPDYPEGLLSRSLDTLLVEIAEAEEEGLALSDLARRLRTRYYQTLEEEEGEADEIRLITCHKAKGLEWEVVILPFLSRNIFFQQEEYPQLVYSSDGGGARVAMDGRNYPADVREKMVLGRRQECQRLLYVAATRARRTLVFVDGGGFFQERKRRGSFSFEDLLQLSPGEANSDFWNRLPEGLFVSMLPLPEVSEGASVPDESLETFDQGVIPAARACGSRFMERVTPSSLSRSANNLGDCNEADLRVSPSFPEVEAENLSDFAAYGNWWHEMMERNPWKDGATAWRRHFQESLVYSPDRKRGGREITLFQGSELCKSLEKSGLLIRTEVPILWRKASDTAYDGFIDMAVWDPAEERWLIVDWKTDRVESGEVSMLVERYTPQLRAYYEAVVALFEKQTEAVLYATSVGRSLAF